jgi:hypothetical protein
MKLARSVSCLINGRFVIPKMSLIVKMGKCKRMVF